jgi:ComF family protein
MPPLVGPDKADNVRATGYRRWNSKKTPSRTVPARFSRARNRRPAGAAQDVCVPVPTSAQRIRERGYNQAGLLAAAFARRTGRECLPALARTAASASQTGLQPVKRRANVAGAFRLDPVLARRLGNAHVILIDDVLTTGATAVECTRILEAGGVRCVTLITFARALDARRLTS